MPDALLFDLDGTLLDSDPLHREVFAEILAPFGYAVDAAFYRDRIHGRLNRDLFAELTPGLDRDRADWDKEARFRDLIQVRGADPTPGLVAFLGRADAAGLPCAVVTNACRLNAAAMLDVLGLGHMFRAVISAEDCPAGKPDPAPYLAGAAAVGVAPARCLAFEDSPSGLASARAAGCTVVGLPSSLSPDALRAAGAHHVATDFTDPALEPLLVAPAGAPA
ncbi:MAG: HAD family phosphatase [Rhodobacter sp.]|nr:HAD family phosphatase [Rhodobacter sp.]